MQYLSDSNWWSKRYHKGKGISRNRVWMPLGSTLVQKNVLFLSYSNIKLILENFFIFLVQCIFSSTIPFFHPLSLNGSNLTETLETVHYGTFRSSIWKYTRSSPDNVNNCNNNWILYNWVGKLKEYFLQNPSFHLNERKISSYLVTAKLYPLERTVGSRQCKSHRYEVCTVRETDTFSSTVTDERIFEYNCLIYSLKCKSC